jgi:methionyl-tRNA formyltransferase
MTPISKVIFLGSKPLGLRVLKTIFSLRPESLEAIVTFDDTSDMRSDLTGFKKFSEHCGKPLFIAKNAGEAEEIIRKLRPDLCLVVCWYWMLKDDLLNSIQHGAIGVHNSLLPKYRGGSPLVWAILNGEDEIGFSVFSLTSEMDAGQIWFQEKLVLSPQTVVGEALKNLEVRLIETLTSGWCSLLDGKIKPRPQRHEEATYCAQRVPEDGKIDWTRRGKELVSFVNAQSAPYPGAFTIFKNQKIILSDATLWPTLYFGVPGQVAKIAENGVTIICGDHRAIVVKTIIQDGINRPAREVLTSIKIRL